MYKKLALLTGGIIFFLSNSFSQNIDPDALGYYPDALRYSQFQPFGTARFMGMGGVNNALGADLSSLAGNPAGLGVYNKSEMGISMGLGFASPNSTYFGTQNRDNRQYLTFPNLGMVFSSNRNENAGKFFRGGSFGIGLTRISNFQNEFTYTGNNSQSSMTDYFINLANGTDVSNYDNLDPSKDLYSLDQLAYWTFLISPVSSNNTNTYRSWNQGQESKQQETVLTKGAINQWNFTYGANLNDRIYLGASVGLPQLRYISSKSYKETILENFNQINDTLDNFRLNESLTQKGGGANFKIGMIMRASDVFRFGFSIQTPTYFGINETYSSDLKVQYKTDYLYDTQSGGAVAVQSPVEYKSQTDVYKYNLVTPMRIAGGVAFFMGKKGFISADLEYVPYRQMYLKENKLYTSPGGATFVGDNATIKNIYKSAFNINLGGELRSDIYRLRAGFSRMSDPYSYTISGVNRTTYNVSIGGGIRVEDYYIDVAIVNSRGHSVYYPYTFTQNQYYTPTASSPVVNVKNVNTSVIISTGFFF